MSMKFAFVSALAGALLVNGLTVIPTFAKETKKDGKKSVVAAPANFQLVTEHKKKDDKKLELAAEHKKKDDKKQQLVAEQKKKDDKKQEFVATNQRAEEKKKDDKKQELASANTRTEEKKKDDEKKLELIADANYQPALMKPASFRHFQQQHCHYRSMNT